MREDQDSTSMGRSSASPTEDGPTLTSRIQQVLPKLSRKQTRLARFLLENKTMVSFATATEIADAIDASAATVVRFAQMLGYTGFPELRDSLRTRIRTAPSFLDQLGHLAEAPPPTPGDFARFVLGYERDNISTTLESLDPSALDAAAKRLSTARRIILIGTGGGSAVVEYLYILCSRIGLAVVRPRDEVEIANAIADATEEDVVLGVTFWRFLRSTSEWLRSARRNGTATIAIVDNEWFPAADHTDYLFVVSSRNAGQGPSVVGASAIASTLVAAIFLTDFDKFFHAAQIHDQAYGDAHLMLE